jgi:rRNA maturation RNase YbeY
VPVELTCRAANGRPYSRALRADALTLLEILALERCELSLLLVGDRAIRALNREFRRKDQTTDVLSFPQLEPARGPMRRPPAATADAPPLALGDIVISIDSARRQARELGQATPTRIRTLLIHGLLHLLGYDHERSLAQARRMFAREHELAALMRTVLSDTPGPRPRLDPSSSPAAMPDRSAKAVKPVCKSKPRAQRAARVLS